MAEEIISLVRECCSTDSGLENRDEYPHLYGLSDRLQSNLDYSRMQMLHRSSHRSPTDRIGIGSFLNNIESENECSTVG
ncbi:hypothetical protein H8D29_03710 [PVC group bacterium]|nr:hypothetical protein [PVC group bacterium]